MAAAPPLVFDRALFARRRARAARAGVGGEFLRESAARELVERLSAVKRTFARGLELGGRGAFARARAADPEAAKQVKWLASADLVPPITDGAAFVADEERLPLAPASLDLVASPLSLHWVNDLPGALVQIRAALKPDGLFLGALFGGATLTELRQSLTAAEAEITGGAGLRVAPFADALDMAGLLQRAGFALPVSDIDRLTVRYPTPLKLLADLRAMGETNALLDRPKRPLRRTALMRAMEIYAERFALADGRVSATFEIVSVAGWAPHPSQQKPAKPGSATARLADALGVEERSAGDKARPR